LIARTTDAVLLQVFINLFDNALYWLKTVDYKREILISINGNDQRVIFSDNGPGIKPDDENYIFEAFYSGKGEEGRGLGLYIARQLLDRYDYSISLAEFSKDTLLKGANFVLEFVKEG
jgi:signal transduction histidine kinase